MISIVEAIADLLFVRDTVVVPGFGAFLKKSISAKVNPVANYFAMPTSEISFDANLREDNDLVVSYISEKNDISENEARRLLVMFVSDCFNTLKAGKQVVFPNLGKLYYDSENNLFFEQDHAINFNADAFGLCDLSPEPVLRIKTKEEIKAEIEQQQKDKNTPITVDEEAVHQKDDEDGVKPKSNIKMWITLAAAIVLLIGLFHFNVLRVDLDWLTRDNKIAETKNQEEGNPIIADSVNSNELVASTEMIAVDTFRIIAGCYDKEEFAQKIVNSLQTKGFDQAFMEKRGERWFVAYGWYPTEEEAINVLREIRETGKGKGWILN